MANGNVAPSTTSVNASDWIGAREAEYEQKYPTALRLVVDMPRDRDEAPDYPRGHKVCANCGAKSLRKWSLDGKAHYCMKLACRRIMTRLRVQALRAETELAS